MVFKNPHKYAKRQSKFIQAFVIFIKENPDIWDIRNGRQMNLQEIMNLCTRVRNILGEEPFRRSTKGRESRKTLKYFQERVKRCFRIFVSFY